MAIRRLGIVNPTANTNTEVAVANASYLASVIITNKGNTDQTARVWVIPSNSQSSADYAYIVYDVNVPAGNSIETHRFAMNHYDILNVRSSSNNMSFVLNGIYDSEASIDEHILEATNVHGIADTSLLATTAVTNSLNTRLISIELGLGIFD